MHKIERRHAKKVTSITMQVLTQPKVAVARILDAEKRTREAEQQIREYEKILNVYKDELGRTAAVCGVLAVRLVGTSIEAIRENGQVKVSLSKENFDACKEINSAIVVDKNNMPEAVRLVDSKKQFKENLEKQIVHLKKLLSKVETKAIEEPIDD